MKKMGIKIMIWAFVILFSWATVGTAADFPQKPIRMIVPWSAGGGNDVLCRAFQPYLEKALGGKILIENIPAGTTKVGTMELMKARPDGYTLIFSTTESWPAYYYSKTYESKASDKMTPIGNITSEPYGFVEARVESPFKTWADIVKAAKENPGKLSCGGPGAGGMMELIMNEITKASGVKTQYVPFAGAGQSKIALLGGHIDFRVCQPPEAITMIRAGKTRGLAVSTDKRMELLPDVPTFKELGVGGTIWLTRSIWGPAKLPQNLVQIITTAIEKATKEPEFVKMVQEQLVYTVDYRAPQKMREELEKFDKEFGPKLEESYK
jgi:tripartite-type tricarboxylate transporter receptor subunit TctC